VRIEQQQETFGPEGQIGPIAPFDAAARDAAKRRDIGSIRVVDIFEIGVEISQSAGGVAEQIAIGIACP
jgi:hypothetical protein